MRRSGDGIEKSKFYFIAELIDYALHSVNKRVLLTKITGEILLMAFDAGEKMEGKVIAFDTFIQVVEGVAEVSINNKKQELTVGMCIVIPSNTLYSLYANERFKMLSTVIKSVYEKLD